MSKNSTHDKTIDILLEEEEKSVYEALGRSLADAVKEASLTFMVRSGPALEFEMYRGEILRLRQINKTLRKKNKALKEEYHKYRNTHNRVTK